MKTCCCHSKMFRTENQVTVCLNPDCSNHLGSTELAGFRFFRPLTTALIVSFILCFCTNDYSSVGKSDSPLIAALMQKRMVKLACNPENLKTVIQENKIICPEEVFAQMIIESGHLSSFLTKRANNLMGMRYPFKRTTTACGIYLPDEDTIVKGTQNDLKKYRNRNHYAVYNSWTDCVADYKLWQDQCFKLSEKYLSFLGNYYAEDANYVSKIKQVMTH